MPEPPALLTQSLVEKISALQRREFDLTYRVRYPYESILRSWREELERVFLAPFYTTIDLRTRQAVWNPTAAEPVEARLIEPLEEAVTAVEDDLLDGLEDEEDDAYHFGLLFGLWELSLGGVEVADYVLPEEGSYRGLVMAAAIFGLPLADRLRAWGDTYVGKYQRALRGSVVQGGTLQDTLTTLDLLQRKLPAQVAALATNEVFRAFIQGERRAFNDFGVPWIWITREDERVCSMCAPLHLTITTRVPVDDTHPDCRCSILPLVAGYTPTPSTFATFAQRFTR